MRLLTSFFNRLQPSEWLAPLCQLLRQSMPVAEGLGGPVYIMILPHPTAELEAVAISGEGEEYLAPIGLQPAL